MRSYSQTFSRAAPNEWEHLSLYVETALGFRRVLDRLETSHGGGENNGDCSATMRYSSRTLAVLDSSTQGYADLGVKTRSHDTTLRPEKNVTVKQAGGDCVEVQSKPVVSQATLRFDGTRYPHKLSR